MYTNLFSHTPVRTVIFCDGAFNRPEGKTAQGVIRHSRIFRPVAVIDRNLAPATTRSMIPGTDIPIVGSLDESLHLDPEAFLVAFTEADYGEWVDGAFLHEPRVSGDLPDFWSTQLERAVELKLQIISCLHQNLAETNLADTLDPGQHIIDIRRPYENPPKYSGRQPRIRSKVIHIAGSDCVIGNRTTALQMLAAADGTNMKCGYIGTGQTCMLVGCDNGAIIDRTPVFQAAGLVEKLIQDVEGEKDLLFIKGQASVLHPAFGGLATAILQGSQPDAIVFVHDPERERRYHWEHLPIGELRAEIELVERLGGAPVAAISTRGQHNIRRLAHVGLPVADPLQDGGANILLNAVLKMIAN